MADENHEIRREKARNEVTLERDRHRSRSRSEDKHTKKSKRKTGKRKSRKRSHSESATDSSSSTPSSDSEQKTVKKGNETHKRTPSSSHSSSSDSDEKRKLKKKKHKKRSSSSDSSSSDSDEKHSKSKHKKKKRKIKKEKKSKSKKKKQKHQGVVDQNKYGAYGILRESDMFVKQQEFYCWLQEVKNVNSETLPKFEARKMFGDYMEDYNTATLPRKKYYDLEKWEARRQKKNELKALKKARETSFSMVDDEKRHELLHRRVQDTNKYAGPSRQQLLEMQQELRRRQDEEYRKKAGLS